jgi:TDG/mug DNA glycosylase family protein
VILPDVLAPGLRIVFCGVAAGTRSARAGAYYAGPGNAFWPTLHAVGLTPHRLQPAEFRRLPEFGLGLTDIAKHHAGSDAELPREAFDRAGLEAKIRRFAPTILAFNGKRAAREFLGAECGGYGEQRRRVADARIFLLPSTSGAARGFWSIEPWRALAAVAREIGMPQGARVQCPLGARR